MKTQEELEDELDWAEEEAKKSHKEDMNSYGAGYDRGYVAALKWVLEQEED